MHLEYFLRAGTEKIWRLRTMRMALPQEVWHSVGKVVVGRPLSLEIVDF